MSNIFRHRKRRKNCWQVSRFYNSIKRSTTNSRLVTISIVFYQNLIFFPLGILSDKYVCVCTYTCGQGGSSQDVQILAKIRIMISAVGLSFNFQICGRFMTFRRTGPLKTQSNSFEQKSGPKHKSGRPDLIRPVHVDR